MKATPASRASAEHSVVLSVPRIVACNPVARAVERARLRQWYTATALRVEVMQDGAPCGELLVGLCEVIGIAMEATEGFNDPADVRGTLLAALGLLVEMSQAGERWQARHAPALCEALDVAVQLLAAVDPADRLKGWATVMAASGAA